MSVKRFQVEIPAEQMEELNQLRELSGLTTNKDLFNNAVTLFKWAANVKQAGLEVCSVDPEAKTIRELQMPVFDVIASRSRKKVPANE